MKFFLVGLTFLFATSARAQDVRVNEIMASNSTTLADEDGDYPDWIELYNADTVPVQLAGYGLSDNPDDPFRWTFPDLTIPPDSFAIVFASGKDRPGFAGPWETVIDKGDLWRYRAATPPSGWTGVGFDDSTWPTGPSGFGYGDGDDATILPQRTTAVYTRTTFTVNDPAHVLRAVLHVDYDDAFVAYLNGTEVARANAGSGSTPVVGVDHEANFYRGLPLDAFEIDGVGDLLLPGTNVLAVLGLNVNANSSDLTLIPILSLALTSPPAQPRGLSPLATGLERTHPHTSFSLNADGESVTLSSPDGTPVDRITFEALPRDVSYGRQADGTWALFDVPTPGGPNGAEGYVGVAPPPTFLAPGGHYLTGALSVTISASDVGDRIYYTLEGSEPSEQSPRYQGPITLRRTTVVRARIFRDGAIPGPVATQTYLLNENVHLPVVAIATNPVNLWDNEKGIYVLGPNAEPQNPNFGANFWQDWEIPVHVELFELGGSGSALALDAGAKIYGAWSRAHAQKSLALFARGRYGTDAFRYPFFDEKSLDSFQSVVLRNSGNDWYYTLFRDAMMQSLVSQTGLDVLAYRPAVVFLNGAYWGIHNIREKISEHYVAGNHGVDPNRVDMLEIASRESQYGIVHGTDAHFRALLDYLGTHSMQDAEAYAAVDGFIEVDNFIDYQIAEIYFGNTDWPGNNVKLWCPAVPGGRWRWILYDTDFGFGLYDGGFAGHETLTFAAAPNGPEWPNPPHSTYLFRRLLENETFRRAFVNRFADHLNETFVRDRVVARIDAMQDAIAPEMPRHLGRWRNISLTDWQNRVGQMRSFAQQRPSYMLVQLRRFFDLQNPNPISLDVEPAGAGTVRINRLDVERFPWQGRYFPGLPVEVRARPRHGYRFAGWSDGGTEPARMVDPVAATTLTALFEPAPGAVEAVLFNEIQYNASAERDSEDWVELLNRSDESLDLSGWTFLDEDDAHRYVLPAGTQIAAGGFLVLCRDPAAFSSVYPDAAACVGGWSFGLSSNGELVRLLDAGGVMVDSVRYGSDPPWPTAPNGGGPTLELTSPEADNALPGSWRASQHLGGTPGAANSTVPVAVEEAPAAPARFQLDPGYPNPFSESTTIRYELDRPGRAVLTVYDVLGREVRTLVDAVQPAGAHTTRFEANGMAGGLYLCRLAMDGAAATQTLLLVR